MSTETAALHMGVQSHDEAQAIEHCCIKFGISSTLAKAHFLAQLHVESAGFTAMRESMNYSVEGVSGILGTATVIFIMAAWCHVRTEATPTDRETM